MRPDWLQSPVDHWRQMSSARGFKSGKCMAGFVPSCVKGAWYKWGPWQLHRMILEVCGNCTTQLGTINCYFNLFFVFFLINTYTQSHAHKYMHACATARYSIATCMCARCCLRKWKWEQDNVHMVSDFLANVLQFHTLFYCISLFPKPGWKFQV